MCQVVYYLHDHCAAARWLMMGHPVYEDIRLSKIEIKIFFLKLKYLNIGCEPNQMVDNVIIFLHISRFLFSLSHRLEPYIFLLIFQESAPKAFNVAEWHQISKYIRCVIQFI